MSSELFQAIDFLEKEKGIDREVLMETLEAALISAYKKNFKAPANVSVVFDEDEGSMKVLEERTVVEEVENTIEEISLEDAKNISEDYEIGEVIQVEVTPKDFGRIAAQTAKQVVTQRVREAERTVIYNKLVDREEDVITGIIHRVEDNNVFVDVVRVKARFTKIEQKHT